MNCVVIAQQNISALTTVVSGLLNGKTIISVKQY